MKTGAKYITSFTVGKRVVDVYGCWDSYTPEGEYDFYGLYLGSVCINLGEPLHYPPAVEDAIAFLEVFDKIQEGDVSVSPPYVKP